MEKITNSLETVTSPEEKKLRFCRLDVPDVLKSDVMKPDVLLVYQFLVPFFAGED